MWFIRVDWNRGHTSARVMLPNRIIYCWEKLEIRNVYNSPMSHFHSRDCLQSVERQRSASRQRPLWWQFDGSAFSFATVPERDYYSGGKPLLPIILTTNGCQFSLLQATNLANFFDHVRENMALKCPFNSHQKIQLYDSKNLSNEKADFPWKTSFLTTNVTKSRKK